MFYRKEKALQQGNTTCEKNQNYSININNVPIEHIAKPSKYITVVNSELQLRGWICFLFYGLFKPTYTEPIGISLHLCFCMHLHLFVSVSYLGFLIFFWLYKVNVQVKNVLKCILYSFPPTKRDLFIIIMPSISSYHFVAINLILVNKQWSYLSVLVVDFYWFIAQAYFCW